MESFDTEFDIGTYGKEDYDVIQCTVEFTILPGDPGLTVTVTRVIHLLAMK